MIALWLAAGILAGADVAPPAVEYQRSGGWLPVIYVDRNGNEVDLAQAVEIAADVAPPEERQEIEAIAETVAPLVDGAFISAQIAADMARVVAILDGFDAILAEAIRRDIITARQAAIDDETALILLMAT
jgi:hypothetical protein